MIASVLSACFRVPKNASAGVEHAMELSLAVGRASDLSSRSEERGREPPPAHRRARFEPSADHDSPSSRLTRSW